GDQLSHPPVQISARPKTLVDAPSRWADGDGEAPAPVEQPVAHEQILSQGRAVAAEPGPAALVHLGPAADTLLDGELRPVHERLELRAERRLERGRAARAVDEHRGEREELRTRQLARNAVVVRIERREG